MNNDYDGRGQAQDLDQLQPPMRGNDRNTDRLACADSLRHSIECAQREITYWQNIVKNLTIAVEDIERK